MAKPEIGMAECPTCFCLFAKEELLAHIPACEGADTDVDEVDDGATPEVKRPRTEEPELDSGKTSFENVPTKCESCLLVFSSVELSQHSAVCNPGKPVEEESDDVIVCPLCRDVFSIKEIEFHTEKCGIKFEKNGTSSGGEPLVLCPICNAKFSNADIFSHAASCEPSAEISISSVTKMEKTSESKVRFTDEEIATDSTGSSEISSKKGKEPEMRIRPARLRCCAGTSLFTESAQLHAHKKACTHYKKPADCPICGINLKLLDLEEHAATCLTTGQMDEFLNDESMALGLSRVLGDELDHLTSFQQESIEYVRNKAKEESDAAFALLKSRVKGLGYTETQLFQTISYLRLEAPLIIHFKTKGILGLLAKDTHYRNQFETSTSGGMLSNPTRITWEDRLFNKLYPHDCKPMERVKYGVLNVVSDPRGVQICSGYGDSHLILKNSRLRATFSDQDTSSPSCSLATCEHYAHVLSKYSDVELRVVLDVGCKRIPFGSSSHLSVYKELQIHGEVRLNRDIEVVVLNCAYKDDTEVIKAAELFKKNHGVEYIWMEVPFSERVHTELLPPPLPRKLSTIPTPPKRAKRFIF
ncbi:hypothetical protein HK096_007394 [Nowakowskiella sp. JEL0078]|nr:hypothetical protein HK096_007394 [Nowakowskiella sp. JEL0078]